MPKTAGASPEVRERAGRLVQEHAPEHPSQWAAISSIAGKIGCSPEKLRHWVRRAERDTGQRPGLTTLDEQRRKTPERENRELRRGQRDSAQSVGLLCAGGVRPPRDVLVAFIDTHREAHGVEPICAVLPIAPSTCYAQKARAADPTRQPPRATQGAPPGHAGRVCG